MPWPLTGSVAPDFDTGFLPVPLTLDVVTADSVWLIGAQIANDSDVEIVLTITDTSGQPIFPAIPVAARAIPDPKEWPFMPVDGLKWQADKVGLVAKLWGYVQ